MGLLGWQDGLSYLTIAATVLLVVRLAVFKLYRSYPILFGYWVADIAATALGLWLRRYIAYVYFYAGWEILKLALAVLVVLELYRVALDGHPALAEFGRRVAGSLLLLLA